MSQVSGCATSNEVARPTESDVPPVGGWGLWPTFRHTESIKETSEMSDLNPTPARRRLLADVQRRRVYQHPDGASLNAGASGRQVTTRIAHLEGTGWVRLGEGSDYDIRYWELTEAGRRVLDPGGQP